MTSIKPKPKVRRKTRRKLPSQRESILIGLEVLNEYCETTLCYPVIKKVGTRVTFQIIDIDPIENRRLAILKVMSRRKKPH